MHAGRAQAEGSWSARKRAHTHAIPEMDGSGGGVPTTPASGGEPAGAQPQPPMSATDLRNVLLLLEVSTSRGAWKASELSQVGAIHDRIVAALEEAGKAP